MSEEIFADGKTYVSSKRAAENTGYAQDYIGQLARAGVIDARRIGGLWYVSIESLHGYKKNADDYRPHIASEAQNRPQELEVSVSFDGKDFISAARAAKITGYNQDYIGQLARKGAIVSRQVGNRWYVDRDALVAHKAEKDRLLGAVQAESVGIPRTFVQEKLPVEVYKGAGPYLTYIREDGDLIPALLPKKNPASAAKPSPAPVAGRTVPIRVMHERDLEMPAAYAARSSNRRSGKTISKAVKAAALLTIVVVLSYGIVELKDSSVYVTNITGGSSVTLNPYLANAYESALWILERLENLVVQEIHFSR